MTTQSGGARNKAALCQVKEGSTLQQCPALRARESWAPAFPRGVENAVTTPPFGLPQTLSFPRQSVFSVDTVPKGMEATSGEEVVRHLSCVAPGLPLSPGRCCQGGDLLATLVTL